MLRQGLDGDQFIQGQRALPILQQLLAVESSPLPDQARRPRRKGAFQDAQAGNGDGGPVLAVLGVGSGPAGGRAGRCR